MKIWKAELSLFCNFDDKWKTDFNFELQEQDYEVNEKFNEWTYFEDWWEEKIPMSMKVKKNRYNIEFDIVQGFDHDLPKEELVKLEKDVRNLMRKQLDYEKVKYLEQYENKLKVV
ncbi:hypothetical protein [Clostridium botulinum]|uniref:hypothetical protein n=1 Tax=Clostridium botulinum TaxID=1491 RepID=UPI001C9B5DD1|nr:hypothetical protein [Clostridium botulinum]MBY6838720.1 hypothetical protein [Clostridium botulinum]